MRNGYDICSVNKCANGFSRLVPGVESQQPLQPMSQVPLTEVTGPFNRDQNVHAFYTKVFVLRNSVNLNFQTRF